MKEIKCLQGYRLIVMGSMKAERFKKHHPGVIPVWIGQCQYGVWVPVEEHNS